MKKIENKKLARWLALALACGLELAALAQTAPDQLLLKEYRPRSIYKIPQTQVETARYRVIDMHSHDYAPRGGGVDHWVQNMDAAGIEKTITLSINTG
jgi:hypothetical protein